MHLPLRMSAADHPVCFRQWGADIDSASIAQMRAACSLPVAAAGALMPDAHVGYGLPIGGVLATRGAVIPYAVGVDIACRVRLSVLGMAPEALGHEHVRKQFRRAIEEETRFGVGAEFSRPRQHAVLDRDWSVSPVTSRGKDKAWRQLGTSGSGNHFVEFGEFVIERPLQSEGSALAPGRYVALLSHSGSRGTGAAVCDHYSKLAMNAGHSLSKDQARLAWLELSSQEGREYWDAMNLMGEYASANHAVIHRELLRAIGEKPLATFENHHNFAWKETHDVGRGPEELIVHRKGATPAGKGVLGFIPGTMASPGFLVRGKGLGASLDSSSHGAGRAMSRTKARDTYRWAHAKEALTRAGVEVISAGIDEAPMVYKDIHAVMRAQDELVEILGRFEPRLVKMAPEGEKAED
ncbi:MAG: RtcB family protein [Phycisphaerales bacterium]